MNATGEPSDPPLAVGTRVRDTEGYTGTVESVTKNEPIKYLVRWDGDTTDWHGSDVLEAVGDDHPGEPGT